MDSSQSHWCHQLIFTLDHDLRLTSINQEGLQSIGYPLDALIGRPLWQLVPDHAWTRIAPLLEALRLGQSIQPFALELIRQDGELIYLEVAASLMVEGTDRVSIHCMTRNVTEQRRLEQQRIQAERLSTIGRLVAAVAHELNNPLMSISGYAQLLLENPTLDAQARRDIAQIDLQATRAARIVQSLLLLAHERQPERERLALNELIQRTLALQEYQLLKEQITVILDLAPQLPDVIADAHQLQQVFFNLITNASYAISMSGRSGAITLRTAVSGEPDGDPTVRVEIHDTGIGIPEEIMDKIFDPFFTTKPVGRGTGLGLAICFGIIQEHSGRIWAERRPNGTTCLLVTLPAYKV
jgi:two-component system NtrC family sensor kinase